jgi:ATP-dependent RNA helicase DDX5/DBP2
MFAPPVLAAANSYATAYPPAPAAPAGGGDYSRYGQGGRGRGGGGWSGRGGGAGGYGGGGYGGSGRGGRGRGGLDTLALPKPDFRNLIPFEKNFYVESPSVQAMSEAEVAQYRRLRDITVEGNDVPKPVCYFQDANFPGLLCQFITTIFIQA